ncbi:hypothetical protein EST38_g14133 [Candolleomyces aberdarensis]|uniref:Proteasome assembly chaperone 2 n=1 Tax=Candolleomyces aberdarensis TaxID=2316362 RepID=A0A4Q2CY67_9AGAR|nr:hypothetical protein EST38_g14133 [Candolleomyces aberdarensis]
MTFIHPTVPANLAGKILLVPIVSTANVAQLAADLLIATLSLQQIAILDPTYCIPVVGGREDGLHGITTPIELFSKPDSKIVVIQQRSPILVLTSSLRKVQKAGIYGRPAKLCTILPILCCIVPVWDGPFEQNGCPDAHANIPAPATSTQIQSGRDTSPEVGATPHTGLPFTHIPR